MLTSTTNGNNGPLFPVNLNGTLLFLEYDQAGGIQVWKSDGTTAGTSVVADINAGKDNPVVENMIVVGNLAYFQADDGVHGLELWQTDGTAKGTKLTADIFRGHSSSGPTALTNVNGTLFFNANDGVHGREPWVIPAAVRTPAAGLAVAASPVAATLASPGSTLSNALLPMAPAPVLPVAQPLLTTSNQTVPLSIISALTLAVITAPASPLAGAASRPVPEGKDGSEVGALDALFASLP
jgi:ELWxxDGT repeat protein